MNLPSISGATVRNLSLDQLVKAAEAYGIVRIHGMDNGGYCAYIKFKTLSGISLEASSEFGLPFGGALAQAIERAETIRGQFK